MKKLIAIAIMLVAFSGTAQAKDVKLIIPALCASNFSQATGLFDTYPSVASYKVDIDNTSVVLSFKDEGADLEKIKEALKGMLLSVKSVQPVQDIK